MRLSASGADGRCKVYSNAAIMGISETSNTLRRKAQFLTDRYGASRSPKILSVQYLSAAFADTHHCSNPVANNEMLSLTA